MKPKYIAILMLCSEGEFISMNVWKMNALGEMCAQNQCSRTGKCLLLTKCFNNVYNYIQKCIEVKWA